MNGRDIGNERYVRNNVSGWPHFTMGALKIREKDLIWMNSVWIGKKKPRTHMETYNDCGHKISVAG
jgi:hypothetical protein